MNDVVVDVSLYVRTGHIGTRRTTSEGTRTTWDVLLTDTQAKANKYRIDTSQPLRSKIHPPLLFSGLTLGEP